MKNYKDTTSSTVAAPTSGQVAAATNYTGKKLVALTFDDGPNTETTPAVLDKLEQYKVVASFFLIGQNITKEVKSVIERQISLGCEINNHSWTHSFMDKLSPEQIRKEIKDTSEKIIELTGIAPSFFRPPFIAVNNVMYDNIDLPFICGLGCSDWVPEVTAEQRADTVLSNVKDGDIILLHDIKGNINTVNALDKIIPGLLADGYVFVTVSRLFELKGVDPHVEYKIWSNTGM